MIGVSELQEIRILSPTGMLGSGFKLESFERGLAWEPTFIGCDSGTTDFGPYYLGTDKLHFSRAAIKRDLEYMIIAARKHRIPCLVGSAGVGGTNKQLDQVRQIVEEIAQEHGLRFRLGLIECEPSRDQLKELYRAGKIEPLANAPQIDEGLFDRSTNIVAMAGVEPFQKALELGADIVLAGRSSDTSIFAAIPVEQGFSPALSWHAAKILECGAAAVAQRKHPDPIFAWVRDDHFLIESPNPEFRCTPVSVASHNLYENASPTEFQEPSGVLHTENARYEAASDRAVRVSGSRFEPSERCTIKLEGAELVGYQSMVLGAVRDPIIIRQLDNWLKEVEASVHQRIEAAYGTSMRGDYELHIRRYGLDAAMGRLEPNGTPGHEVGVVIEITAPSQELATALAKSASHIALHHPVPEWSGLITTLAFPYSPPELNRGPVYRFNLHHVVEPASPLQLFKVDIIDI